MSTEIGSSLSVMALPPYERNHPSEAPSPAYSIIDRNNAVVSRDTNHLKLPVPAVPAIEDKDAISLTILDANTTRGLLPAPVTARTSSHKGDVGRRLIIIIYALSLMIASTTVICPRWNDDHNQCESRERWEILTVILYALFLVVGGITACVAADPDCGGKWTWRYFAIAMGTLTTGGALLLGVSELVWAYYVVAACKL